MKKDTGYSILDTRCVRVGFELKYRVSSIKWLKALVW